MAELAEADREKILGANYKQIEREAQERSGIDDKARHRAEVVSKAESGKLSAIAIAIVGVLLIVSNSLAVSGPSAWQVALFGAALVVAAAALYWRQVRNIQRVASL